MSFSLSFRKNKIFTLLVFSNNITVYDWKFKYLQNNCQDSKNNGTDERKPKKKCNNDKH